MKAYWMVWGLAAVALLGVGAIVWTRAGSEVQDAPIMATADTARIVLDVHGMACTSCASTIEAMLRRTPGVVKAAVTVARAEAVVEFDPAQLTAPTIVEVVQRLGYRVRVKAPGEVAEAATAG